MLRPIPDTPALIIKTYDNLNLLVIADLHIGFEIELASYGIMIPSQTRKLIQQIKRLTSKYSPTKLILLGDIKHEIGKISQSEWIDVPNFLNELIKNNLTVEIVLGNHDGNIEPLTPRSIALHSSRGILIKTTNKMKVGLIHGHAWPSVKLFEAETIVMGHLHPLVELKDRLGFKFSEPVWAKIEFSTKKVTEGYLKYRKIKYSEPLSTFQSIFGFIPKTKNLIIMPAFNTHLGGAVINREVQKSYFTGPISEIALNNELSSEIYLLDGTFLGSIKSLKAFS